MSSDPPLKRESSKWLPSLRKSRKLVLLLLPVFLFCYVALHHAVIPRFGG
jgi:hypothetical protein